MLLDASQKGAVQRDKDLHTNDMRPMVKNRTQYHSGENEAQAPLGLMGDAGDARPHVHLLGVGAD